MLLKPVQDKRKGSVLVEYGLLIAGIVLVCVVSISVLGMKTADQYAVLAAIMPGAHTPDNVPIAGANAIPFTDDGTGKLVLDSTKLVDPNGKLDRMAGIIGPGGGELLIIDFGN
jgi:hypothetical protein